MVDHQLINECTKEDNDVTWIIEGSGAIGELMPENRRIQILSLIRDQYSRATLGTKVPCPCGREINITLHGYRCYHCGVVFCDGCARQHFGDRPSSK